MFLLFWNWLIFSHNLYANLQSLIQTSLFRPCTLKKTFLYKLTDDEEEKEAFVKQAAQDWATILLARSYELAKGCDLSYLNNFAISKILGVNIS